LIQKIIGIIKYNIINKKRKGILLESVVKMPDQMEKMNPKYVIYFCESGVWYGVVLTPSGILKKGEQISLEDVPLKYRNPTQSV
jgi:hypothetical protein